MNFSEKVKRLRREMKLSQVELAKKIGVSARSLASYEAGTSYPRYRKTYDALAAALGVDVNYLRTEDEETPDDAGEEFDTPGQRKARAILTKVRRLFASDELSEDDKLVLLTEMMQLYINSMRRSNFLSQR